MSVNRSGQPCEDALARYGKSIILVPLIIGGALIVAAILIWHARHHRVRLAEATRVEEEVRRELRAAHIEMRALRPAEALERTETAKAMIALLPVNLAPDYAELKMAQLLIEGESLLMLDCRANAPDSEALFNKALTLMTHASGEVWQFGMLGRARARYEAGRFPEALSDLNAIMDRNASSGAAYYWRSLTRRELGDAKGAGEDERRARALDSWPPLRDFMQAECVWTRDILSKPEGHPPEGEKGALIEFFAADADGEARSGAPKE